MAYDKDKSGSIEVWELKEVLEGESSAAATVPFFLLHTSYFFLQPWDSAQLKRSSFR